MNQPSSESSKPKGLRRLLAGAALGAAIGMGVADEVPKAISKEVAGVAAAVGLAALAMPDVKRNRKPETVGSKMLTFNEAVDFLRENNIPIDLQKLREADKAFRIRALGIDTKKAEWDDARLNEGGIVSEKALQELLSRYKSNPDLPWEPEFDFQDKTDSEAYEEYIVDGLGEGRHFEDINLKKIKKIDPITGKSLEDQRPTRKPRIIFTRTMQNLEPQFTKISANAQLEKMKGGTQYMSLARYIKLFLKRLDEGVRTLNPDKDFTNISFDEYKELREKTLTSRQKDGTYPIDKYLLDTKTETHFADSRHEERSREGADLTSAVSPVLVFFFHLDNVVFSHGNTRKLFLTCSGPDFAYGRRGGREELV